MPLLAVGVDAGSLATRCVIAALEGGRLRYLGHGEDRSNGWVKDRVADQAGIAESIRRAVQRAEAVSGAVVDAAAIGVGGVGVDGGSVRGLYEFGRPRQIDTGDITYAVERATNVQLEDDRILLHALPQDFTVDGRAGFRNPRGTSCSRLEANVHIVTAPLQEHACLVSAMHEAHLAVEDTVFEPLAAAYASVTERERASGVALIDLGAYSTEVVVYEGEAMAGSTSFPIGGDHFTRDVAWCLKVPYDDAVRLKEEFGCAILGLTADSSLIELPAPDGRPEREASRRQLNEILEARAEELFEYIRQYFRNLGLDRSLLEGVVLTGGGATLYGMCDMAERVLNCPARIGLPMGIADWPDEVNGAAWTTAAGLAMYSARLKQWREPRGRAPSLMSLVFSR